LKRVRYTSLNIGAGVNDAVETMWKKAVVVYFKVLS
jgi:hypothetical protein